MGNPIERLGDNAQTWQPGQSGNPGGRPKGSWGPADYLRFLQGEQFTEAVLVAIRDDRGQPMGRRAAARMILATVPYRGGDARDYAEARRTFESINDRLEGKTVQSTRIIDEGPPDVARVLADLRAELVGGGG